MGRTTGESVLAGSCREAAGESGEAADAAEAVSSAPG